ncbi:HlyD family secretion protein [Leisingera aquaemixtae]|uniref:HlyD family secretion protein n=1 Tax=Leisingera aquaemixtae TaxID=1396826 RepID=UPI0021A54000|nr:HlyD family secretion protein [Leisingera aquaemixtae]UWQ36901.1 HlyD family secretion protein [Leisingera aquaemixtae]
MINRILRLTMLLLVAASVCGLSAYYGLAYWTHDRFFETTDNAYVRGDIVAVAPNVAGHVVEVNVSDNKHVARGDVLFRINPENYEAKLAEAGAALRAAQAARAGLVEERTLQKALIDQAEAGLVAAKAEAVRARRDRDRAENLVRDGWASHQRFDTAIASEAGARAKVQQAEAVLSAQRQKLGVLDTEASRLDAVIEQASARKRLAEIAFADTVVRAPAGGIIGNRHVEVGHYARPGAPLLSIVPRGEVWIVANFKETQLARLAPGQTVQVTVDSFGRQNLIGYVDSVAPASGAEFSLLPPDNATGNFVRVVQRVPVKIVLAGNEMETAMALKPGMSATVRIDTRQLKDQSGRPPNLTHSFTTQSGFAVALERR